MQTSRFAKPAKKTKRNGMTRAAVLSYRPPRYEVINAEETAPETNSPETSSSGLAIAGTASAGNVRFTEVAEEATGSEEIGISQYKQNKSTAPERGRI